MRILLRVLGLPFALVGFVLAPLLRPVARRIDSSPGLSRRINRLSSSMATRRGLLLAVGAVLLVVSWLAHGVAFLLMVVLGGYSEHLYWLCVPVTLLHVSVLTGFTGMMLAVPLGQGYGEDV